MYAFLCYFLLPCLLDLPSARANKYVQDEYSNFMIIILDLCGRESVQLLVICGSNLEPFELSAFCLRLTIKFPPSHSGKDNITDITKYLMKTTIPRKFEKVANALK